jgi:histidinol phosphatase-like enzyme
MRGFHYCPHLPDGAIDRHAHECNFRKPNGMAPDLYAAAVLIAEQDKVPR